MAGTGTAYSSEIAECGMPLSTCCSYNIRSSSPISHILLP
jgi:hypothetical protein